ncbi:Nitrilotriacetate monooxygenase component B [Rhodovastum atsumiense]|uniref:Flavin reductase family protein n=1 Tax=Rhodovastum atsumiense TaxID=504468 RepID=A0A5M6J1F9_9PROT|nr:flavin reductase family protein [Rhodovastum atsumiense]KAA5614351.1 flavin reductase family protein [Rhodovastum atsumiense]CAH2604820.1 Nitrilotriacetate monooxygenase component B [Rhodovastum atsumiense]
MLFDFATLAPQDRYKLLTSTVVPRPIAWVVTQDRQGRLNAAPFSFFNVFSQDPALVVLGIGGRAAGKAKDSGANIRQTGEFVVNLVSHANLAQMNVTAIDFPPEVDEIAEAGLTTLPSTRVAPPRIAESPVALECRRFMVFDLDEGRGLVVGEVLAMHIRDDCMSDPARLHVDTPKLDLVGRMHGGGWYVRTTDLEEVPRISLADWQRRT